jgi:thiol-disulfide isomerase/thioredoxin
MRNLIIIAFVALLFSCSTSPRSPKTGRWLVTMDMTQTKLPFYLDLTISSTDTFAVLVNNSEKIRIDNVELTTDSIHMYLPFFRSEFHGKVWKDDLIYGNWFNKSKGDKYIIPFKAEHKKEKFDLTETSIVLANKWQVNFGDSTDNYPAIALLEQNKNKVTGTFLTETGDYRFLDGYLNHDTLLLHAFDGAHAFTFTAVYKNNELTEGKFYSGSHYSDNWTAFPNDSFELANPYELTSLNDTSTLFDFTFRDLNGKDVSLSDTQFDNKVKIVQIMGTWCPNCMDETNYYAGLYDTYAEQGLEIIALAYEKDTVFSNNAARIASYKKDAKANYTFLFAGKASKSFTSESLPQLSKIISYPTSIFIDRLGNVVKIHTGFYGPSTGDKYEDFKQETEALITSLL